MNREAELERPSRVACSDLLGHWCSFFKNHVSSVQEYRSRYKDQAVSDKHANRVPIAVSPHSPTNLNVSAVAGLAIQKIMPISRIAIESIATKVKVNKDKAEKINECQNDDRNDNELGSPRHSPSRTSGVKKRSHLKWPNVES
jgi:hypothetical protein